MPWQTIPSARLAVTRGSFCRSDPAAALRGLAKAGRPASVIDTLSRSKASHGQEHLAADLEQPGHREPVRGRQPVGHGVDRLDVGRDVLAGAAVTPGEGPHQPAVLVEEVDREAVDLELAQQVGRLEALALQTGVPPLELVVGERVVEALHPLEVVDRGELGGHRSTDLLGRRVGGAELGEPVLQRLELAQPHVEVGVRQRRVVEHVVAPAGVVDLLADLPVTLARLGWGGLHRGVGGLEVGLLGRAHGHSLPVGSDRCSARHAPPGLDRMELDLFHRNGSAYGGVVERNRSVSSRARRPRSTRDPDRDRHPPPRGGRA